MHLTEEGQHMMLAEREDLDVLYDDHLVVVLVKERTAQDFGRILAVALGEEAHRLLDALRRGLQAVAAGVFAQAAQNLADDLLGAESADAFVDLRCPMNRLAHRNWLCHVPHPSALGNRAPFTRLRTQKSCSRFLLRAPEPAHRSATRPSIIRRPLYRDSPSLALDSQRAGRY